jgi:hypothetical protein
LLLTWVLPVGNCPVMVTREMAPGTVQFTIRLVDRVVIQTVTTRHAPLDYPVCKSCQIDPNNCAPRCTFSSVVRRWRRRRPALFALTPLVGLLGFSGLMKPSYVERILRGAVRSRRSCPFSFRPSSRWS